MAAAQREPIVEDARHCSDAGCVSFWFMAQNARFALSLKVLAVLAGEPDAMHTSAAIAESLKESAVMVRRTFLLLHKAGLIVQRKGPNGGAKLKIPAKQIGLGDIFDATAGEWLAIEDKALAGLMKKVHDDAVAAMNEHSLSGVVKRLKKA
jgi:DNA-binding IscR family transcriptional regulator